jgi:hypothetical protein
LRDDVKKNARNMGELATNLLLAKKFEKSLDASDRAINRAYALMFLGRLEEARKLYRAHRCEKVQSDKIWEDGIREDFTALRKAGLTQPLMGEIEREFTKRH